MYTGNSEMLRLAVECGFQVDGHAGDAFQLHHPQKLRRMNIFDNGKYEVVIEGSGLSDFQRHVEKLRA